MKKYLFLFIIPLLSLGLVSCDDDDDDVKPMNPDLLAGVWEVEDQGSQEVFDRNCILNITTSPELTGGSYGGYQGIIETSYLTVEGFAVHDKVYSWSIREVENHQPLLDLVLQGMLDSSDLWEGNYFYKITKLTDSQMWWQVNTVSDNSIIKFRRRNADSL